MPRWTPEQLKKFQERKPGAAGPDQAPKLPKVKRIRKESPLLLEMKTWLRVLKVPFEQEFKFHPDRDWRFDIALIESKIAVEYEGVVSEKSRHTSLNGYTNDADKYNAAQKLGWKVLRYTALNYQDFMKDIVELLNIKTT